jgi:hypothetical protein
MKSNLKLAIQSTLFGSALLTSAHTFAANVELLDSLLRDGLINPRQYNQLIDTKTPTQAPINKPTTNNGNVNLNGSGNSPQPQQVINNKAPTQPRYNPAANNRNVNLNSSGNPPQYQQVINNKAPTQAPRYNPATKNRNVK